MKVARVAVILALASMAAGAAALAAEESLNAIVYPEKQGVKVGFAATDKVDPKASASASVTTEKGKTSVEVSYKKLNPALLFGGDVTSYVVWGVVPDGTVQNLGELRVRKDSGSDKYQSSQKTFAMIVTAEVAPMVEKPSGLIIFKSNPSQDKKIENRAFNFSGFTTYTKSGVPSISGMKYEDKTPVELQQAKKVVEIGDRLGASQFNASAMTQAHSALDTAIKEKDGKKMLDAAARAMTSGAEAVRDTMRIKSEQQAAADAAKNQAEKDSLSQRAASAETGLKNTTGALVASEQDRRQLQAEKQAIAADRERLRKERDDLQHVLETALSKVAEVTESVRGTIVNLPGILFDLNKSALKPGSQVSIAKLAGILLVYQGATVEIEGHTDSTGQEATNMKLSEARAKAVYDFLQGQGIDPGRMKFSGMGPKNPLTSNDTPEGRAKNRRVEVVISGVVKAGSAAGE
jgi:outer membrane protein OmpA-like peptidoglycan-associated protein